MNQSFCYKSLNEYIYWMLNKVVEVNVLMNSCLLFSGLLRQSRAHPIHKPSERAPGEPVPRPPHYSTSRHDPAPAGDVSNLHEAVRHDR